MANASTAQVDPQKSGKNDARHLFVGKSGGRFWTERGSLRSHGPLAWDPSEVARYRLSECRWAGERVFLHLSSSAARSLDGFPFQQLRATAAELRAQASALLKEAKRRVDRKESEIENTNESQFARGPFRFLLAALNRDGSGSTHKHTGKKVTGTKGASKRLSLTVGRTLDFWRRAIFIYGSYKICQWKSLLLKAEEKEKVEKLWEEQHEFAAEHLYRLCADLGGFFLKSGQFLAKPDLVPAAWVRRLSVLHDAAPADSMDMVKAVVEEELGQRLEDVFLEFCPTPLGSASIAQVHRAKLRADSSDVAVKVQHLGGEELMMMDLANQRTFTAILQKLELPFDFTSIMEELQSQVRHEFDFTREAAAQNLMRTSLSQPSGAKKRRHKKEREPPVIIPLAFPYMTTRRVLVMEFIDGVQILRMPEEMRRRGIRPTGPVARMLKMKIFQDLAAAYGHMILRDGHFHADPHPGNILICKGGKVALLDFGQTKKISDELRLNFARLILALEKDDIIRVGQLCRKLGIRTKKSVLEDRLSIQRMATLMFDTKRTSTVTTSDPFSQESTLKQNPIQEFPRDLFFIVRTVQLLRGLSLGMDVNISTAQLWRPIALEVLPSTPRSTPTPA
eukprot:TRINITY_DN11727_c0_g1_i1.p1 TRINITY_DN11727_c0_g1~~TRINITY_DN11727_c0_g1_i1.p1  ORF type:complete len:621 (-),score=161.80 TRINITY_DN11727_c0_g1_i1:145-2007(-)